MAKKAATSLSLREQACYGLSDLGYNLIFNVVSLYMMYYYTDVALLPVAAVGTLFLVVRFVDALAGPVAGFVIDKTKSRFGRARPWLLRMAVPFPFVMVLTFSVPDSSDTVKLVWVYVTYTLMNVFAAMANVPVNALLPSLTESPTERTKANAFRNVFGQIGVLLSGLITLPLVNLLGGANARLGFTLALVVMGVGAAGCYVASFANTRERVAAVEQDSAPMRDILRTTLRNRPWWILFVLNLILFIGVVSKGSSVVYFFKYTLGDEALSSVANTVNALAMVAGMIVLASLVRRFGRRNLVIAGLGTCAFGQAILWVASASASLPLTFVGLAIGAFGLGGAQSLVFVMMADVIDFGEWKFRVRAQGFISGGSTLGVQFGAGIAGALSAWVLDLGGFVPNVTQSASALSAITTNLVVIPLLTVVVGIVLLLFYRLDKQGDRIRADLADRRAARAAEVG